MTDITVAQALQVGADHHRAGRLDLAEDLYRRILTADPNNADAHHLLGVVATQSGHCEQAVAHIQQSLTLAPENPVAFYNLGIALQQLSRLDDAIMAYERCLALVPDYTDAHNNLGLCQAKLNRFDAAIAHFRRAIELNPNHAAAHTNLADALVATGDAKTAVDHFNRSIALNPTNPHAFYNFGNLLGSRGHLDQAIACFQSAVALKPDFSQAWNNLATAYHTQGRLDDAINASRQAVAANPDAPEIHSNLLFALQMHPDIDGPTLLREHLAFSDRHAAPLYAQIRPHTNDPTPDRKLRIGYLSGDFCNHPVGRSMINLLPLHDRTRFEIYCFSARAKDDETSRTLHSQADHWRDVTGLTPPQIADTIRADSIDILIDLSLHSAHNQLLVFALKPAPVQVTYLAYPGTSGLSTMDYRITDTFLDPPNLHDDHYTEKSFRISNWCYQPPREACDIGPLPADSASHITFASLNSFTKVSALVQQTWARILSAVPGSRLILHCPPGSHRDQVLEIFARQNVSSDRIELFGRVPFKDYFPLYNRIDIALDPFPYGGGTTTAEAVHMGVPVISLIGKTAVGRMGFSLLSRVGLSDLAADSLDSYVQTAAALASDLPRLRQLRITLRQTLQSSSLCNSPAFIRELEDAFQHFWKLWCDQRRFPST